MKTKFTVAAAIAMALSFPAAHAQTQGVTKDEIILGTIADLSGPLSGPGKQIRNGMLLRIDEVNEQGGINGRKIVMKVEDVAYDPRRAVLAAQKLVNGDRIFAMLGSPGTAPVTATFPVMFPKNVISFLPVTAAREMYEPLNRLKFAYFSTYYQQTLEMLPKLVQKKGAKRVCSMYQDDELGHEVLKGAEEGLKTIGMKLEETASYKRGATDFSTQMQRLAASKCDLVVLAAVTRETIGGMTAANRLGFNPTFFGSAASYGELIPKLGGSVVNGLYAAMSVEVPSLDSSSQPVRFWANKYQTKFSEEPGLYSLYGYIIMDVFAQAATKAGPALTTDSFIKAMESTERQTDIFGSPPLNWTATKRLGNDKSRLSQIQDGRWKLVTDIK